MKKENKNQNGIYIIVTLVLLAFISVAAYCFIRSEKAPKILPPAPKTNTTIDSTSMANKDKEELGQEDSVYTGRLPLKWDGDNAPWSPYRIIGHSSELKDRNLQFGDKVWVNDDLSQHAYKVVLGRPANETNNNVIFKLKADLLIEEYRFDKYKTNFSLTPFAKLSPGVKKILLDDNYSDGNSYNLTQNEARAKSSVTFGDFDEDGIQDVAIIMDNNEKQISRLLILCSNKITGQPYIAFAENYTDKMRIHSFKEKAKIYMNTKEFVPAPRDGILLKAEDVVLAIVYDPEAQKFKTYFQE